MLWVLLTPWQSRGMRSSSRHDLQCRTSACAGHHQRIVLHKDSAESPFQRGTWSGSLRQQHAAMQSPLATGPCSCSSSRLSPSAGSLASARLAGRAIRRAMSAQKHGRGRLSVAAVASVERMLKTVSAENLSEQEIKKLLARPRIDFTSILGTVSSGRAPQQQRGRRPASSRPGLCTTPCNYPSPCRCHAQLASSIATAAVGCDATAAAARLPRLLRQQVGPIVEAVRADGDAAVRTFTEKFDKVKLDAVCVPTEVRTKWQQSAAGGRCRGA